MKSAQGSFKRVAFACMLAWVALGTLSSPISANAKPARYVFEACDSALPGGGAQGIKFSGDQTKVSAYNGCANPSEPVGIYQTFGLGKDAANNSWSLPIEAPAGGWIESMTLSAWSCGATSTASKIFVYEVGWPVNCAGESQRTFSFGPATRSVNATINLGCASECSQGAYVWAHYFAVTEVDPVAPTIGPLQGSLLSGGVVRGHQRLSATATDEGGGLGKIELLVNGQAVDPPVAPHCNVAQVANLSVKGTVAASNPPCPTTTSSSWTVDTAAYPFQDGSNAVAVCASDFATLGDPNVSCSATQTVDVDNSCAESPVGGAQALDARFADSNETQITVPFDRSAKVIGGLASSTGDPIVGATICVQTQTLGSQGNPTPIATTTTDVHGHFSYKVPPGPNRRLSFGYRHDAFQVAQSMRYLAHAKPSLSLSPERVDSGGRIRISGKVPGPSAAGRVVVLQASALHSPRWFTFHRATTDGQGVFHSSYRFDATTRTTIYRIRAVIPRQSEYPWEVGHSTPAQVKVRVGRYTRFRQTCATGRRSRRSFEAVRLDRGSCGASRVAGDATGNTARACVGERSRLQKRHFAVAGVGEFKAAVEEAFAGGARSNLCVGRGPGRVFGNGV
jgi:hypothetical protein